MPFGAGKPNDQLVGGIGDDFIATRALYKPVDGRPDTVNCGTGVDGVSADEEDTISVNCESVQVS